MYESWQKVSRIILNLGLVLMFSQIPCDCYFEPSNYNRIIVKLMFVEGLTMCSNHFKGTY